MRPLQWSLADDTLPGAEPFSVGEIKEMAKIDDSNSDAYLATLIVVARRNVERRTNRMLIVQKKILYLDRFPREIFLPVGPVTAIDEIGYTDTAGAAQTLAAANYQLDASSLPQRLKPAYDKTWPTARNEYRSVQIKFTGGYGAKGSDVPEDIRHAVRLLVTLWERHRLPVVTGTTVNRLPEAVDDLLASHTLAPHPVGG